MSAAGTRLPSCGAKVVARLTRLRHECVEQRGAELVAALTNLDRDNSRRQLFGPRGAAKAWRCAAG